MWTCVYFSHCSVGSLRAWRTSVSTGDAVTHKIKVYDPYVASNKYLLNSKISKSYNSQLIARNWWSLDLKVGLSEMKNPKTYLKYSENTKESCQETKQNQNKNTRLSQQNTLYQDLK